jgi:hypothetical protein
VKTFDCPLKVFFVKQQLEELDQRVNDFIARGEVKRLVSVSDTCTTDDTGATIGLIRVVAYE